MAISSPIAPFLWGNGGAMLSPEQVARDREMAAALMGNAMDYSPVDHWLQGAARAAQGLVGGLKDRWAIEAEASGREGFQSRWDEVFGGGQGASPAIGGAPSQPVSAPTSADAAAIRQGLINRGLPDYIADAFVMNFQDESGLNPGINEAAPLIPGSRGGYGLYQLTGPRRTAYEQYAAQQGVDPANVDAQLDFMMSELQGPEASAYQAIMSAPDTGSAAAAIVNEFLRPAEEHRARRAAAYMGGAPQMAQANTPDIAALLGLASDPWANETQRSIINSLVGQQLDQQAQANDPLRQLQIERAMLENEALRNPAPVAPDPTSAMQNYEYLLQQGVDPETALERAFGGQTINVGGPSQTPGDDKFYETLGSESAKRYASMIAQGGIARRNLSQLDVASDLLQTAPQGPMGLATLLAGRLGVDLGGLNEAQALNAVINQMVPAQREPGSGPMSDKDIEMYRASVVSLANQPGGNALIIDTARAINQYDLKIAEIAGKVEDGLITRAEARAEMAAVPNPIDAFREARKQLEEGAGGQGANSLPATPNQSQAPRITTQEEYDALPSGAPYMAPDGTIRTKR